MFQGLGKGNLFYILRKGDQSSLQIGKVINVISPAMPYGSYVGTMEVVVSVGENTYNFKELLPTESLHEYPYEGVTVSDNKDMIRNKIEASFRESMQVIESCDYHKKNAESCDKMLRELNPQLAKEKAQQEKIESLEKKVVGMDNALTDIKEMLSKALNNSSNNSKKQQT